MVGAVARSPFGLDCELVNDVVLFLNVNLNALGALTLCNLIQVIHIEVEPCVAVIHILYLVVDVGFTILVTLLCDVDISLHNIGALPGLGVLICYLFLFLLQRYGNNLKCTSIYAFILL